MILLDSTFPRLLQRWLSARFQPGQHVEGWLFEGRAARREAEAALARAGISARLRSAYKPLVHALLEEIDTQGLSSAEIRYPVVPGAAAERFLLEAYPAAELLPDVSFVAGGAELAYQVTLRRGAQEDVLHIDAPNCWSEDHLGMRRLSPCAWLRVRDATNKVVYDEAEQCEFRQLFDAAMHAITQQSWGQQEPYFERLLIEADIPALETALPGETASTAEALHEEFYFSLLEFFQRHSGRPLGDRGLRPGQIVPVIRHGDTPRVRVSTVALEAASPAVPTAPALPLAELETPPSLDEIAHVLQTLGGEPFDAPTRQGRRINWRQIPGGGAPVLISGAQHANETSGVVGALRAAQTLLEQNQGNFAILPVENPDGYALFAELRALHPDHMHHAARYSAMGDDVAYREGPPQAESLARHQAIAQTGAQLHINLHGYPSHEWTRPLTGYLPRGFEAWTLPKGFFLILRYHPGYRHKAELLADSLTARLAQAMPELAAFNARQLARYQRYGGVNAWPLRHGVAVMVAEDKRDITPLSLTAEFPDETIYGPAYQFAHTVQMHTVLAAVSAWRELENA